MKKIVFVSEIMKVKTTINIAQYESIVLESNEHDNINSCHEDLQIMINFYSNYFHRVLTYKKILDNPKINYDLIK